jgi:hypothetical protein
MVTPITKYQADTPDKKEFSTREAAEQWERRNVLIDKLYGETCCNPDDAEEAVDWLLAHYDIVPKQPSGPVCTYPKGRT